MDSKNIEMANQHDEDSEGFGPSDTEKQINVEFTDEDSTSDWDWDQIQKDTWSGLTVALALVPEAVSFSFVAGVEPKVGLTAAWMMVILTGYFGGRPGMISAATGATAAVMTDFIDEHGVEHLFPAVMLCGILQILFGLIKVGKLSNFISEPVMVGFCNGLAIVIGYAQLELFQDGHDEPYVTGTKAWLTVFEVLITMLIVWQLPNYFTMIPSSLCGIIFTFILEHAILRAIFDVETAIIEDFEDVKPSYPIPYFIDHDFSLKSPGVYFPLAIRICCVGLIESLLTLKLIDEITQTQGQPNQECIGQGIANLITGFCGGMGGCAMIGQSMINMNAGARLRLSSYVSGLFLFVLVAILPPVLNMIPVSGLVGVMFMVVIETFEWRSLKLLVMACLSKQKRDEWFNEDLKVNRGDVFIIFLVTIVTQLTDLAVAVLLGIAISGLIFAWSQQEPKYTVVTSEDGSSKTYEFSSPLFFASCSSWRDVFNPQTDPKTVCVHFHDAEICDYSALHALNAVAKQYQALDKTFKLRTSHPRSVKMVNKAQTLLSGVEIERVEVLDLVSMNDLSQLVKDIPRVIERGLNNDDETKTDEEDMISLQKDATQL